MVDTQEEIVQIEPGVHLSAQKVHAGSALWHRFALVGIMLISIFMNFFQLGQNGFGNLHYAAGVRSMLDNWHNFFFVSYDAGGFGGQQSALTSWLTQHCTVVSASEWHASTSSTQDATGPGRGSQLYECASAQ